MPWKPNRERSVIAQSADTVDFPGLETVKGLRKTLLKT